MQTSETLQEIQTPAGAIITKRTHNQAFCLLCGAQVGLITFSQAAIFAKTKQQEVLHLAEKGKIHRLHNSKGEIMICFDSLMQAQNHLHETKLFSNENFSTLTLS